MFNVFAMPTCFIRILSIICMFFFLQGAVLLHSTQEKLL